MSNTTTATKWVMPEWMEKYIPLIRKESDIDKHRIERAFNASNGGLIDLVIQSKVELLQKLHDLKLI